MTTQSPATAKIEKWLRFRLQFFPNLYSGSASGPGSGSERKTQNSAGVNSGTPDPVPPLAFMGRWATHGKRRFKLKICWISFQEIYSNLILQFTFLWWNLIKKKNHIWILVFKWAARMQVGKSLFYGPGGGNPSITHVKIKQLDPYKLRKNEQPACIIYLSTIIFTKQAFFPHNNHHSQPTWDPRGTHI